MGAGGPKAGASGVTRNAFRREALPAQEGNKERFPASKAWFARKKDWWDAKKESFPGGKAWFARKKDRRNGKKESFPGGKPCFARKKDWWDAKKGAFLTAKHARAQEKGTPGRQEGSLCRGKGMPGTVLAMAVRAAGKEASGRR